MPRSPYKPKPRASNITVVVQDAGPMDEKVFEAWVKLWVQTVMELDRKDPSALQPAGE
jgi:hypothetical protein